jgi:glucosamine--fructose-6-phosphate aminotransferase (isomerizing)
LKKNINQKQAACMQDELLGVADLIDDTNKQLDRWCGPVADIVAESGMIHLVGSGPCFGAAQFGASKFTEAAGLAATAQDVDSWWHVCRFTIPANLPLFVIAAPGRSDACAEQLASAAQQLGRTIIAVADARHETLLGYAAFPLPVVGRVREEFSPLLYHLFANHVACYAAQRLGRLLFQSNPSNFVKPISKDATGHFQHHRH